MTARAAHGPFPMIMSNGAHLGVTSLLMIMGGARSGTLAARPTQRPTR